MRTELEPYLGQVIYIEGRVANFKDRTETFGPTSDLTQEDVKDVCLKAVKFSLFDPDLAGTKNQDAFFNSNLRTDHLWVRIPECMAGNPQLLSKQALLGRVGIYTRRDGSEDIGVELVEILKAGDALAVAINHIKGGSVAQAYAILTDLIECVQCGAGMLIAPNASHNKILPDIHRMRAKCKPAVQLGNTNKHLKQLVAAKNGHSTKRPRPCTKSRSTKGFA